MRHRIGARQIGGDNAAVSYHQIGDHSPLGKADALVGAGKSNQRTADFSAGGVAIGMKDASQRVSAFAGAQQFAGPRASLAIEGRAPLDQLRHAHRAFSYQGLGCGAVNDSVACVYGVFQMERNVLVAFYGHGDPTLRVMGVGLARATPW